MQLRHAITAVIVFVAIISPALCFREDEILTFLDELKVRMCHPIPKLGIPALDPLQIEHKQLAMNNQYLIDFTGSTDKFALVGLSDFAVNDLRLQTVPLRRSTINVTFPLSAFKTLYTAKGSLAYILNLAGDGNGYASLEKFTFSFSWVLRAGTTLGIRGLQINFSLGGLQIDFENLIEEERVNDFFHAVVNELGLELLNDVYVAEHDTVEQAVENYINAFIGQYTISDIIKLITGGGGGGGGGEGGGAPIFEGVPGDCKDTPTVEAGVPLEQTEVAIN